jgi:hypothetical protein
MSTKININEQKMQDYYEKLMDRIYLEFFDHSTHLERIDLSPAERAQLSYYQAQAKQIAESMPHGDKKVHIEETAYSNGLRRR